MNEGGEWTCLLTDLYGQVGGGFGLAGFLQTNNWPLHLATSQPETGQIQDAKLDKADSDKQMPRKSWEFQNMSKYLGREWAMGLRDKPLNLKHSLATKEPICSWTTLFKIH